MFGLGDDARDRLWGDVTAWRWRLDADAVDDDLISFKLGVGRGVAGVSLAVCISPAAEESLLVKDEMAQPVHPDDSLD